MPNQSECDGDNGTSSPDETPTCQYNPAKKNQPPIASATISLHVMGRVVGICFDMHLRASPYEDKDLPVYRCLPYCFHLVFFYSIHSMI